MTERARMMDLLCLGEPLIEFNQRAGGPRAAAEAGADPQGLLDPQGVLYPQGVLDPQGPLYLQGYGGDTSNTAIAAARLGAKAGYVTRIGADPFGDRLMRLWAAEGVATDTVTRDPQAPTGIYFVTHDEAGHHFQYYRAGSAASRMTPETLPLAAIRAAQVLHVSAISQAISASAAASVAAAIAEAREAGVQVCYDTNLRLKLWPLERARAVILATMQHADILRPSLDDARLLTGLESPDEIIDFCLSPGLGQGAGPGAAIGAGGGPKLVVLTLGQAGVLVATRQARRRLPAHHVPFVDATGAGDAFNGALLARLIAGDDPFTAATFANAAAALSTTGYGAVAPLPREDAVRRLLAGQG